MPSNYTGVPSNIGIGPAVTTIPSDGDALAAASVNSGMQSLTDYGSAVNAQLQAMIATTWFRQKVNAGRVLNACAGTAGLYAAVGDAASSPPTIFTSPDGIVWTAATAAGTSTSLSSVAYGASTFVAVGPGASGQNIQTGTTSAWTLRTSGVASLKSVVWNPILSLFVAVGAGNACVTSPTGTTWTPQTIGVAANDWYSVTCNPVSGTLVAVGYNNTTSTPEIYYSTNGTSWTRSNTGFSVLFSTPWNVVGYAGGLFVAAGNFTTYGNTMATSPDGINWTMSWWFGTGIATPTSLIGTGKLWICATNSAYIFTSTLPTSATIGWTARILPIAAGSTYSINGFCMVPVNQLIAPQPPAGQIIAVGNSQTIYLGLCAPLL